MTFILCKMIFVYLCTDAWGRDTRQQLSGVAPPLGLPSETRRVAALFLTPRLDPANDEVVRSMWMLSNGHLTSAHDGG